jgi:DNA-binding transcriptional ArsR family regulator
MDLTNPYEAMFPTVDSAVLRVLAGSTKPRTGREVARLASRSQAATQRVLDRLVTHGLVLGREAGRARVYELNREHLAAESIADLANLRSLLFWRMHKFFRSCHVQPLHASVFGSAARGDGGPDSDIDIFLVRPAEVSEDDEEWQGQVEALAKVVFEWTGNHAGIAEVGEDELDHLRRERPRILSNLRADAVDIIGFPAQTLLRGL